MSRYLVTGAAGFIGARVAGLLLDAGHEVVGVDNLNDAYDVRLKEWRLRQLTGRSGFAFHRLDVCDREALSAVFSKPGSSPPFDAVINLAARAGIRPSVENPTPYLDTNVGGTLNLLELCRRRGVRKFALASSSSVYGESHTMPCEETVDTSHPISPYAASKKAAEVLTHSYHRLHGLDVTIFRYFTVFGPAGRPDMSPLLFVRAVTEGLPLRLFGDGRQSRDFTFIDDIAKGTIAGLRKVGYEILNLGNDHPVPLIDVIGIIERLVGRPAVIRREPGHPADVRATWASIRRAREILGWSPEVGLEAGFASLVEWYRQNRDWASRLDFEAR